MQRDLIVKSRSLGGSSDLTLLAPIRRGFVQSLESVTYKTRVKRVLEALQAARQSSHEYAYARLLSDAVERVGVIHSVRVAVLEPEDHVMLAVTFDGSWESYIRVLWEKVGTLLDLIFCSTVDYITARDHTFEEWLGWARLVQVETGFFYGPPDFTSRDVVYHRRIERMRQRGLGTEMNELSAVAPSAEEAVRDPFGRDADDVPFPPDDGFAQLRSGTEEMRNGLQALGGLYRLTDLFRPGTTDGDVLRFASASLLRELTQFLDGAASEQDIRDARQRFSRQLDWLYPGSNYAIEPPRVRPPFQQLDPQARTDVQGGILRAYEGVSHGMVLLLSFDHAQTAHDFLAAQLPGVTRDSQSHQGRVGTVFANLAFTPGGLRAAGMGEDDLELFPEDFRQGMAARAGALGDVRSNHPRRWALPQRFAGLGQPPAPEEVHLDAVHALLQLRGVATAAEDGAIEYWEGNHPLRAQVQALLDLRIAGLRLLAIQSLKRTYRAVGGTQRVIEHFGFADGDGQPDLGQDPQNPPNPENPNLAHLGEVLYGYSNAADAATDPDDPGITPAGRARLRWLKNGSFLVVRKYHQDVKVLREAVEAALPAMMASMQGGMTDAAARDEAYSKLMGRYQDGRPMVDPLPGGGLNDFDYSGDARGLRCPLHAHIRRANPRLPVDKGSGPRPPRIMRRGMSYGPPAAAGDDHDRGLLFMAYNASFSEQFEVIQRWLAGGNSTGASSGQSCPIVGVPDNGYTRQFRFVHGDQQPPHVIRVQLEQPTPQYRAPATATRLEWGLYLFTPSIQALERLRNVAGAAGAARPGSVGVPWRAARGRELIAALRELEARDGAAAAIAAWKEVIEDPDAIDRLDSAGLWAAIREEHGGVLRTPYGVLVASRELLLKVYRDRMTYSVSGQRERMIGSIGDISLGKDEGQEYRDESEPINSSIRLLGVHKTFDLARTAAHRRIQAIADLARQKAADAGDCRFEVAFDLREVADEVLADLSEYWFGIGAPFFHRGSADWSWQPGQPPIFPGQFTALSRYMFQPNPGPVPVELGQAYGKALTAAMLAFVQQHRQAGTVPQNADGDAPVAAATFRHPMGTSNPGFIASTMVGVLMGFTPTIIGAVLNVAKEWHRDGTFARLREACARQSLATYQQAFDLLHPAIAAAARMRPMPQIGWRRALVQHRLGPAGPHAVDIEKDDVIVLAMVSGTQQSLADGHDDGRLMFGGKREETNSPTHACPGYTQGIAAMLGTFAALLERAEDVRTGPAAMTYELRSESGFKPDAFEGLLTQQKLKGGLELFFRPEAPCQLDIPGNRRGLILAWGDSWVGYFFRGELRDQLENFGYTVPEDYTGFRQWLYLKKMAEERNRKAFRAFVRQSLPRRPLAILLSAGGNDSVEEKLDELLVDAAQGQTDPINHNALSTHLGVMRDQYLAIIDTLRTPEDGGTAIDLPIILHGYDHPFPVNRGIATWIRQPFRRRGYKDLQDPNNLGKCDLVLARKGMETLIDALNRMLKEEVADVRPNVRYVNLRGSVAALYPQDPVRGWANDLHPEVAAWECMAAKIDAAIRA